MTEFHRSRSQLLSKLVGDVVPGVVVWPSIFHIHAWIENRIVNRHETAVICVVYKNFIHSFIQIKITNVNN